MDSRLKNHNDILRIIKTIISKTCKTKIENIDLKITNEINYEVIEFYFHFIYMYTKIGKPINLYFRIYNNDPEKLEFESCNGPILFDKKEEYKEINSAMIETIKYNIDR